LKTRENARVSTPDVNAKTLSAIFVAICVVFYAGFSESYHPLVNAAAMQTPVKVSDAADIFSNGEMPRLTEELFGDKSQALNFIFVAKDDAAFANAMKLSGWVIADKTDVGTVLKIVRAELFNQNYEEAPMTPSFWNTKVNYFGFEKPTAAFDAYSRYHLRVWKTNFETSEGAVYVGTVRLDTVNWIFVHKSNPDVDAERELLFSDLKAAGEIIRSQKIQFTNPVASSSDLSENPFFTDGKLYEIVLK